MVHEVGFRGCSAQSGLRFIALLIFQVSLDLLFSDRRQNTCRPLGNFHLGLHDDQLIDIAPIFCLESVRLEFSASRVDVPFLDYSRIPFASCRKMFR